MINQRRIDRFIELLEANGVLTAHVNTKTNHIEIFKQSDPQRIIARRPLSDFSDASVDLITLIPS